MYESVPDEEYEWVLNEYKGYLDTVWEEKTNEVQGINFNDRNGNFCCSYTGMNYSDIKDSNYRDYQEKKQQMEEKREENDKMEDTKQERLIPKMIANNADNADNDGQSSGEGEEPMSNNFRLIPRMIQENRQEALCRRLQDECTVQVVLSSEPLCTVFRLTCTASRLSCSRHMY